MKTQIKKSAANTPKQRKANRAATTKKQVAMPENNEAFLQISLNKIDFSSLNYRKYFSQKSLEDFAREITVHGIISPITVRPLGKDKYELVAGERRVRAARIAGLKTIPAIIRTLSDEQVSETQLAENIQRENPHPLHEAQAINNLLQNGKTIDEAALRLGKSKAFVYNRMKLAALIEPLQTVFLADKMTLQQAIEIAKLPAEAQQQFFDEYCEDWEDSDFELEDLGDILYHFRYDLKHAPFNLRDKKLLPEAGACTGCPFNSATLKSLFPEMAKEAICNNKSCYHAKSEAFFIRQIKNAFAAGMPDAVITLEGKLSDAISEVLEQNGVTDLPVYNRYEITTVSVPEEPDNEDYLYNEDENEDVAKFDENGYNEALQEYKDAVQEYEERINSGEFERGLFIRDNGVDTVYFTPSKINPSGNPQRTTVTAKEVQEAIKEGKATPELLQQEIDRLNAREERAKELDAEKLQLKVHEQFAAFCANEENNKGLTKADSTAARLLVYQILSYSVRYKINDFLFSIEMKETSDNNLHEMLAGITDAQFSHLIRMAIVGKSESKSPKDIIGYSLYRMAEDAGMNIGAMEEEQQQKIKERQERLALRIEDLEKRIARLQRLEKELV